MRNGGRNEDCELRADREAVAREGEAEQEGGVGLVHEVGEDVGRVGRSTCRFLEEGETN